MAMRSLSSIFISVRIGFTAGTRAEGLSTHPTERREKNKPLSFSLSKDELQCLEPANQSLGRWSQGPLMFWAGEDSTASLHSETHW
jgi:hypothetical protein